MLQHCLRFACVTLALACILITACGDDDPAAADSPCDDANTTCVNLTVSSAGFLYSNLYDIVLDETTHYLQWDFDSEVIAGFAPGERMILNITFDDPIKVRYNHLRHLFILSTEPFTACSDRFASATGSASAAWRDVFTSVALRGDCTAGASQFDLQVTFESIVTKNQLRSLTAEFTVPQTYTSGTNQGTPILAGDLPILSVQLVGITDGDTTNNPPAWPGEYPAAATTGRRGEP